MEHRSLLGPVVELNLVPLRAARSGGISLLCALVLLGFSSWAQQPSEKFAWPEGKRMALSLSFDDARLSQVEGGTALLDSFDVKGTFYVVPAQVAERLDGWKAAVAHGHEIGNHTLIHPCSGNYPWSRQKALEDYTLKRIKKELADANEQIEKLLGVKPRVFAYPCGQSFVGRGVNTKSFVPVVAKLFFTGRTYRDKTPNDPLICDFAQLTGIDMDEQDFEDILPLLERAKQNNQWLILGGHEMGEEGSQTTRLSMLRKLLQYAGDPAHGVWVAPVGTVAGYVSQHRK
jgi:peptidoglycan/xylan/chitin deacetylase (PgdA/CDA1 family)